MGSLAKWGAIAGLGKGIESIATTKKEDRQAKERIDAEEARQMRIEKWRAARDVGTAKTAQTSRLELADYQDELTQKGKVSDRAFTGEQAKLERENKRAVARINQSGRTGAAPEWVKNRLKSTKISVADGMGGETQTAGMFDAKSGITYAQIDGVWQSPPRTEGMGNRMVTTSSIKVPVKDTSEEALTALKSNPTEQMVEDFFEYHGWLPLWAFKGANTGTRSN